MPNREITFRLKGDELMIFPINGELAALLSALPKSNVMESRRYVFTRVDGHSAERIQIIASGGVVRTVWRKALLDAGIDNFRFHDLASHLRDQDVAQDARTSAWCQNWLGHTNIETTSRYAHVLTSDLRDALDGFSIAGAAHTLAKNRFFKGRLNFASCLGTSSIRPKAKLISATNAAQWS